MQQTTDKGNSVSIIYLFIQAILIALKVAGYVDASWLVVLIPTFVHGAVLLIVILAFWFLSAKVINMSGK